MLAQSEVPSIPGLMSADLETRRLSLAVSGSVLALLARHGVTKLIGLAGSIVLARILFPSDYGVFAIVSLASGFIIMLGDLGLGSALVQRPEAPTTDELQAIFTFQQCVVIVAAVAMVAVAPIIGGLYHLSPSAVWLVRFMAFYLFATSFRSIPQVILSRRVRFAKIALVDVVSGLIFQVVTISAALAGYHFWSFGLGLTISAVFAAILINVLAPWPMGWRLSWRIVRSHLKFGLPFQGTVLVAAIELAAAPLLLGLMAGAAAVGYAALAFSIANIGLIVPNLIMQVAFPAMSRIQGDGARLARALELALKVNCYAMLALYLPLFLFGRELVGLVFSARWIAAAPLLTLILWSWILRSLFATAGTTLNALGKSQLNFRLHLALALASWTLVLALVPTRWYVGLGEAWLLASLPLVLLLVYIRRLLPIRFAALIRPATLFALAYGLGWLYAQAIGAHSPSRLVAGVLVASGTFVAGAIIIEWSTIRQALAAIGRPVSGRLPLEEAIQSA
jgi:teichuronic acid exporter